MEDYTRFLELLERVHNRYGILVHSYVLMSNHYHLLIETPRGNLVATLHDLNTAYSNYFNRKYNRVGHLFQGRCKSILVDKDSYLLELSRYIHLNPIRVRMVQSPEKYKWSSYSNYFLPKTSPDWLCTEEVLKQLDEHMGKARRKYRQFVEEGLREKISDPFDKVIAGIVLGGDKFWEGIKERFQELRKDKEIPSLRKIHRKADIEEIVDKITSFYRVSRETICQKRRPSHPASQVALYLTRKKTDLSLNEIGAYFGGRHYTAVSVAYRRVAERRQHDQRFHQELNRIEKEMT